MGLRSPDGFAVPLCPMCHRELHSLGDEQRFFANYAVDPHRWIQAEYELWSTGQNRDGVA